MTKKELTYEELVDRLDKQETRIEDLEFCVKNLTETLEMNHQIQSNVFAALKKAGIMKSSTGNKDSKN